MTNMKINPIIRVTALLRSWAKCLNVRSAKGRSGLEARSRGFLRRSVMHPAARTMALCAACAVTSFATTRTAIIDLKGGPSGAEVYLYQVFDTEGSIVTGPITVPANTTVRRTLTDDGDGFQVTVYQNVTNYAHVNSTASSIKFEAGASYGVNSEDDSRGSVAGTVHSVTGVAPPQLIPVGLQTPIKDADKPIWENLDTTLTADLFREGVDKIASDLRLSGTNSVGISADPAADSYREGVAFEQKSRLEAMAAHEPSLDFTAHNVADAQAQGAAAQTLTIGLFTAVQPQLTEMPFTITEESDGPMVGAAEHALSLRLPARFGGAEFIGNPFTADRFQGVASWFKTALSWLILVKLATWLWARVGEEIRAMAGIQQAKGNTIAAGMGGQATSLLMAAAITVAMVTAVTALLSWTFGGISFSSLHSVAGTNPLEGLATGVLWMMQQALPVATGISALLARLSFNIYGPPLFAGVTAVIRWLCL